MWFVVTLWQFPLQQRNILYPLILIVATAKRTTCVILKVICDFMDGVDSFKSFQLIVDRNTFCCCLVWY